MTRCLRCGSEAMATRTGEYHYRSLSSVLLVDVDVTQCSQCGEEYVSIPKILVLHMAIARSLLRKPGRYVGSEIRFLRKELGWSGRDFARRFGVSHEHVSRWENDSRPIGAIADRLLRLCVVVDRGIPDYKTIDLEAIGELTPALEIRLVAPDWELE